MILADSGSSGRLLTVAMVGVLAGCVAYRPAPISASANAAALEARSLHDPRLNAFIRASLGLNAGPVAWNVGTLTLAGLYFQPDIAIARSKLAVARAAIETARQRPNPTLVLTPLYNLNIPTPTPWTVGGIVNFVIETAGKREARTERAIALAEAARWDLATAGWQVRTRVRTALLALWASERRLALARDRLALQSQLVRLLAERLVEGQGTTLDLARERVNRSQSELAIEEQKRATADARVQLASAISVPARALDGVSLALAGFDMAPPPIAQAALRTRALAYRSDVRASLAEYQAAEAALRLQVANQYPNLTIGPEYNWGAIQEAEASNQVGLPLGVELPVFHHNQGPIAEAVARRRQAAANLNAVQARVIGQVDAASADYAAAERTVATAGALAREAARRLERVKASFRAGAVDRPALVLAEIERTSAETALINAKLTRAKAAGDLEDALQQPLFDPLVWPLASPRDPSAAGDRA